MNTRTTRLIRMITAIAIFGAIAAILYVVPGLQVKLPFFPSFLELHFDEIPCLIAGFAYGPTVGFGSLLLKTIIKLPFSSTLCVGELTDLLISCAFIIPAALFYKHKRKLSGALIALSIGIGAQLVVSFFTVMLISLPFYEWLFGMTPEALLSVVQKVCPWVTDLYFSYGFYISLPFNALKDACVIVPTFLVYKVLRKTIDAVHDKYLTRKIKKEINEASEDNAPQDSSSADDEQQKK